jgi:hypothetical protein
MGPEISKLLTLSVIPVVGMQPAIPEKPFMQGNAARRIWRWQNGLRYSQSSLNPQRHVVPQAGRKRPKPPRAIL